MPVLPRSSALPPTVCPALADRHLAAATDGWDLRDLRHTRLTHAGEDGLTEADLMNLSGHEDRRTLQRYLKPSKEATHRRLDEADAQHGAWPTQ